MIAGFTNDHQSLATFNTDAQNIVQRLNYTFLPAIVMMEPANGGVYSATGTNASVQQAVCLGPPA